MFLRILTKKVYYNWKQQLTDVELKGMIVEAWKKLKKDCVEQLVT